MTLPIPVLHSIATRVRGRLALAGFLSALAALPLAAGMASARDVERCAGAGPNVLPTPVMDCDEVHAGQRVMVRWRSLAGQAEELELVFSLDDGRAFDVRVSPELSGDECRYQWRVPNVGVRCARMRLRARIGGCERSGPVSPEFRIVPDPLDTPGLWVYRGGEWWESRSGVPFDLPGLVSPPRSPSMQADDQRLDLAATERAPELKLVAGVLAPAYVVVAGTPADPKPSSAAPHTFQSMRE